MVQTRLFKSDCDSVVLVLLEEILDTNMNPRLRLQMQRQTYVEWPTDKEKADNNCSGPSLVKHWPDRHAASSTIRSIILHPE